MLENFKTLIVARKLYTLALSIDNSLKRLADQGETTLRIYKLQAGLLTEDDLLNAEKQEPDSRVLMQTDEEMADLEELENKAIAAGRRPRVDEMPLDPFDSIS